MTQTSAAAMRFNGARVALVSASMIVSVLLVSSDTSKACMLAAHVLLLFGCGVVLLSPTHRAVAAVDRRGEAAAFRWYGMRVALSAASVLVHMLFVDSGRSKLFMLTAHVILLFGCAAVFLSPAHRAVAVLSWPGRAAAMLWYGMCMALAAASVLVHMLFVDSGTSKVCVLASHVVLLFGNGTVLLSPVHRAVAALARRAAAAAWELFGAPLAEACVGRELRWPGLACILFYGAYAAGDIAAGPAVDIDMPADRVFVFLLFLMLLAGVWMVALSMLRGRASPQATVQEVGSGEAGGSRA